MAKHSKEIDFNKFLYNEIKVRSGIKYPFEATNLLNWSLKDLDMASQGKKTITVKEMSILIKHLQLDIDSIYEAYMNKKK